jgi:hypothetical protein
MYAVFSLATFMAPACVSKFGVKREHPFASRSALL